MRRVIDNDILTLIVRVVVGSIFIYASYYKVLDPASFAKSIWFYHMVPGSLINLMALIMAWMELVCGIALIVGFQYRGAVIWINIMTIIFMIALTSAVMRGISIDCGCFKASAASSSSAKDALIRDIGLLVLTLQLLFSKSKKWLCQK